MTNKNRWLRWPKEPAELVWGEYDAIECAYFGNFEAEIIKDAEYLWRYIPEYTGEFHNGNWREEWKQFDIYRPYICEIPKDEEEFLKLERGK